MVFTSPTFLFIFFPVCSLLVLSTVLLEKIKPIQKVFSKIHVQEWVLLAFSLGFYMWTCTLQLRNLLCIILAVYLLAKGIEWAKKRETLSIKETKDKKHTLWACFLLLVGVAGLVLYLALTKYTAFLSAVLQKVLQKDWETPQFLVPLGISFITFSAISYLTDVYRGHAPAGSLLDCALYLSFFPKVISGPIVLWKDFAPQLKKEPLPFSERFDGINLIILGFVKKVMLADLFGQALLDFGTENIDSGTALFSMLLYMLQIYYDFAGYSDIAIGLARLFGFRFKINFNFPYRSKSISEFWRRWHISLGTWFKEYIYFPLGGSRVTLSRTLFNLFVVFLLTGIWHGAGTAYLVWGLVNAFFVLLERVLKDTKFYKAIPNFIKYSCTMLIVMLSWLLFRFENVKEAWQFLMVAIGVNPFPKVFYSLQYFLDARILFLTVMGILGATVFGSPKVQKAYQKFAAAKVGYAIQEIGLLFLFVCAIICMVNSQYSPFIYFQY